MVLEESIDKLKDDVLNCIKFLNRINILISGLDNIFKPFFSIYKRK